MSLPQSTIEQLQVELEKERKEKRGWITQLERANDTIERLSNSLSDQADKIAELSKENEELRARVSQ